MLWKRKICLLFQAMLWINCSQPLIFLCASIAQCKQCASSVQACSSLPKPHFASKPPNLAARPQCSGSRPGCLGSSRPQCLGSSSPLSIAGQSAPLPPAASSSSKVTPPLQLLSGTLCQIQQLPLPSPLVSLHRSMTSQFEP